jgi:hypothetical protein
MFQDDTQSFEEVWVARIAEYERGFKTAVDELRALQEQQLEAYVEELGKKRPLKPKPSRVRCLISCRQVSG